MQIVDRQFDAYQAFVLGCKLFWTNRIYPELYALYRRRADEFYKRALIANPSSLGSAE